VDAGHDDEVWDEEADEGVAAEGRDVGSNDGVDLADERLNETVQSANLLQEWEQLLTVSQAILNIKN